MKHTFAQLIGLGVDDGSPDGAQHSEEPGPARAPGARGFALGLAIPDLVLISLLGACSGATIVTTTILHALLPLPGLGGMVFIPLTAACVIIARVVVGGHPLSATLTRFIQQGVVFVLPGGPPWAHHPLLFPLLLVDALLVDLWHSRFPLRPDSSRWTAALVPAVGGMAALALQVGVVLAIFGHEHPLVVKGWIPVVLIMGLLHAVLRGIGGALGLFVVAALPRRRTSS